MHCMTTNELPLRLTIAGVSTSVRDASEAEQTAMRWFKREGDRLGRTILYSAEIIDKDSGRVIAHILPKLCALQTITN